MARKKSEKTKELGKELTQKQKLFCDLYVSQEYFGNGVRAYAEAYGIDIADKGKHKGARSSAHNLLTNPDILTYIDSMLDDSGFNDANVDKELLFVINQKSEMHAKVAAIKEYNQLRRRVSQNINVGGTIGVVDIKSAKSLSKEEVIRLLSEQSKNGI